METEINIENLNYTIEFQEKVLDSLRSLIHFHDGRLQEEDDDSVLEVLGWASSYYRVRPNFPVFEAMISTGSVELIPSELAQELATSRTKLLMGQMDEWPAQIAFEDLYNSTNPFGGQLALEPESNIKKLGIPFVDRKPDLTGLIADETFAESVFRRLLPERNITEHYKEQRKTLLAIVTMIDAELAN